MINVVEEEVQSGDALSKTAFEPLPFGGGNDARDQVEGEDALRPFGVAIDIEGDALSQEGQVCGTALLFKVLRGEGGEAVQEFAVVGPDLIRFGRHLVKETIGLVVLEQHVPCGPMARTMPMRRKSRKGQKPVFFGQIRGPG